MTATKKQVGGKHYTNYKIQPIEFITSNNIGFIEGNVIKYVTRFRQKNGIEDIDSEDRSEQIRIELTKTN